MVIGYCPKCGTEIEEGEKFCKHCGIGVNEEKVQVNESLQKIIDYYDIKEEKELLKQDKIPVPWIFRSALLYSFAYIVGGIWYLAFMLRGWDPKSGIGILIVCGWGLFGYVKSLEISSAIGEGLMMFETSNGVVFNVIGQYLRICIPMIILGTIDAWVYAFHGIISDIIVLLAVLNILFFVLYLILTLVIGHLGIGLRIFGVPKYIQRQKEIDEKNREIGNENSRNKYNLELVQALSKIQNIQFIQYMADAIDLYNEENYDDALANVRRALESYLYQRMEQEEIIFSDARDLNTYEMIKKLGRDEQYLHSIRRMCNTGVHALESDDSVEKDTAQSAIREMLSALAKYSEIYKSDTGVIEKINNNLELFFERAQNHAKRGNEKDGLLNTRKALECIVRGYMKFNHIICSYGHEKNLNGYIDMLFEQKIISENSKNSMHRIRMASNKGAHVEKEQSKKQNLNVIISLLEKEIEIYLESQKKEPSNEELLDQISEYEGEDEMLDELDDDYDDDYDDMDDYDDNEYYDDSGERYYEDADEDEYLCAKDLHNPANYYNPLRDSTYRSHDPNEYYNVFDDREDYINGTNSTFDANVLGEDDNAFYC